MLNPMPTNPPASVPLSAEDALALRRAARAVTLAGLTLEQATLELRSKLLATQRTLLTTTQTLGDRYGFDGDRDWVLGDDDVLRPNTQSQTTPSGHAPVTRVLP